MRKTIAKKVTASCLLALLLGLSACGRSNGEALPEETELEEPLPEVQKPAEEEPKEEEPEETEDNDNEGETIHVQVSGSAMPRLVAEGGSEYKFLDEYVVAMGQSWSINGEEPEKTDMTFYLPTDESGEADLMSAFACTRRGGITTVVTVLPMGYDMLQSRGHEPGSSLNMDTSFLYADAPEYIDLQQSELYETENGSYRISTYGRENKEGGGCYAVYQLDYIIKSDDYSSLNLSMMIRQNEVTDETEDILTEMEAAYGITIGWDRKEAEKRAEELSAYAEENGLGGMSYGEMKEFSIGYLTFELPEDWKEDSSFSNSYGKCFAPGGSANRAGAFIRIQRLEGAEIDVIQLLDDEKAAEQLFGQFLDTEIFSIELEDCGKTCLGSTVLTRMRIGMGDSQADYWVYLASDDDDMYMVEATLMDDTDIDVFDYAEHVLESGKMTGK